MAPYPKRQRSYSTPEAMIKGPQNGEHMAAEEFADMLFEAARSERIVDDVLSIVLA